MKVEPIHAAVGYFFKNEPMFKIPKYQRSYAWEKDEIEDFIDDLKKCFLNRKSSTPINHFFGGIVSVEKSVAGANQKSFELVDGQQRVATFVLLIAAIISLYQQLETEANASGDNTNVTIIQKRIIALRERFIEFQQETNRNFSTVEVLVLSKADADFFRDLVRNRNPTPTRNSHERLSTAYKLITKFVKTQTNATTLNDKLDNLEIFNQLVDIDLSLIHIKTQNRQEAYTLFRVLNDRGKSLTEGDLLKANVLELLESYPTEQASVEQMWDSILADDPSVTEDFLKWVYISYTGKRIATNDFIQEFSKQFYPIVAPISSSIDAAKIVQHTRELHDNIAFCRQLYRGDWPFIPHSPIVAWDTNRLSLLVNDLNIKVVIPLLLSAIALGERNFSTVVQMLERFMFRFKTIGSQEIGPLNTIIYSQSTSIRANPTAYNISNLETQLHALQIASVPDATFKTLLTSLVYKPTGGNQALKYFLHTMEHYRRWYNSGATGQPFCIDKSRIYDFKGSTIEHVYPRNPPATGVDAALTPLTNTLGNLTFMGQTDNNIGGNDSFAIKKPIFLSSSVMLNQEIGQNVQWTAAEVNNRAQELKDMACAVYNV